MSVFWYQVYQQGFENACGIVRLAERFDMHSQSQAGKLDVKRRKYQLTWWFTLQTSDYEVIIDFCVHSKSATLSWPDKDTCREIANVNQVNDLQLGFLFNYMIMGQASDWMTASTKL